MAADAEGGGGGGGHGRGRSGGVEFALDEHRTLKQVLGGEPAYAADAGDDY